MKRLKRVPCDGCGVNVFGDNGAHIIDVSVIEYGRVLVFCGECWPDAQAEIAGRARELGLRAQFR